MSVAQIINEQIRAMDKWAFIRWGAKDKVAYPNGLKFKTSGLVKWKGYNTSENTWEPIAHLDGCHQKVKQYHKQKNPDSPRRKENSSPESN